MSKWRNIPREDIDLDGDEINVLIEADSEGNVYVCLKVADVLEVLKGEE